MGILSKLFASSYHNLDATADSSNSKGGGGGGVWVGSQKLYQQNCRAS